MSRTETAPIHADLSINDVIRAHPKTMSVFNQFNIDSCCGGARSLRSAAEQDGAPLDELVAALNAAATAD